MLTIIVARHSGFCFGVTRAVQAARDALGAGEPLTMLGEVVHNPSVIGALTELGARVVNGVSEIDSHTSPRVLVRAHGVGIAELNALSSFGVEIIDKTCPKVKHVHDIAYEATIQGKTVLLVGDENHPEVRGTAGWCVLDPVIVANMQTLADRIDEGAFLNKNVVCVSQTTFSAALFDEMRAVMLARIPGIEIYDTICPSTAARQAEVLGMARGVSAMLIIGGKSSSNTMKLYDLARACAPVCRVIERAEDLNADEWISYPTLGVASGSSTPEEALNDVLARLKTRALERGIEVRIVR